MKVGLVVSGWAHRKRALSRPSVGRNLRLATSWCAGLQCLPIWQSQRNDRGEAGRQVGRLIGADQECGRACPQLGPPMCGVGLPAPVAPVLIDPAKYRLTSVDLPESERGPHGHHPCATG